MIAAATDPEQGCGILVMSAPCDDAQWRAYIRTVDEMQAQLDPRLRVDRAAAGGH